MDVFEPYKIFFMVIVWFVIDYFMNGVLSAIFVYKNIRSRRTVVFCRVLVLGCQSMFCAFVMAISLPLVSGFRFFDLFFSRSLNSSNVIRLDTVTTDFSKIKPAFIFVFAHYIYAMLKILTPLQINLIKIFKYFFFAYFFCAGYLLNYLGMIYSVGIIFSFFALVDRLFSELCKTKQDGLRRVFLIMFCISWLYVYVRLIPFVFLRCLFPLPEDNSDDIIPGQSFRALFVIYYTFEVLNSPITRYWRMLGAELAYLCELPFACCRYLFPIRLKDINKAKEAEDSISTFTAQGKPANEIKKQVALMQMVKCVMALQKKTRRIREKKEKIQEERVCDMDSVTQ